MHLCCIIKIFKNPYYFVKRHPKISMTKLQEKSHPVILIGWSLNIARYLEFTRPEKDPRLLFDMENEKALRMEELESGQQEMQEKISRATKMVINLTKWKGITDDLGEPASWKGSIDPFIVPNLNNHGEQEELRKNQSRRSNHVDMQQRCNLLDKKLKEDRKASCRERV